MSVLATLFAVDKSSLPDTKLIETALPALQPGQVLLKVDRFALTANNITYAELGERLSYWQFFPTGEDRWGNVPAWGFGEVLDSRNEAIKAGERIYGFLPMGTHAILQPGRINPRNFVDASEHRSKLPPAYNLYIRCGGDPGYREEYEDLQALLQPLFITSFLIDDFLGEENIFGAEAVLLSSASSKTAFGLAYLLHKRKAIEVVGLTSAGNRSFARGLGCYDKTVLYGELPSMPGDQPVVYVDFAGSGDLRRQIHEHYRGALTYSCAVGLSHRDIDPPGKDLPGPRPIFFFAPDRLRKRAADWGRDGLERRVAEAWEAFVPAAKTWLEVTRGNRAAVESVYRATLDGKVKPSEGHMLSLWG